MQSNEQRTATELRRILHFMLMSAFVDIRAANSLSGAAKLADVYHNAPMRLLSCECTADYEALLSSIMERAKRHNLDVYLEGVQRLALRHATTED